MSGEPAQALKKFDGIVRLFPLPNLVLFPPVTQGLHIFEPRYRAMTADALAADRLLAVALLRPGWEKEYEGRPSLYPVACLGRIVADQRLADGRYNLRLDGLARIRILEELPPEKPYRRARAAVVADRDVPTGAVERALREQLGQALGVWIPAGQPSEGTFREILAAGLSLSALCDLLGYVLPLGLARKQELLEADSVRQRALKLLAFLRSGAPTPPGLGPVREYPPEFSAN